MWGGPLRPDSPPQKTPEAVALGQGRGLADGEAELSTPPPPPARRVNYPSWSDSSSPPGTRAAAHSLINLINVISVGFGVGAHCSADGGHSAQSACHLVGVLCGFSKAAGGSELLRAGLLAGPFSTGSCPLGPAGTLGSRCLPPAPG